MSTSRKSIYWLPTIAALFLALGLTIGFFLARRESKGQHNAANTSNPLLYLSTLLESYYVDPLPPDSIYRYSVEGLLTHLDPHTVYIPASELQAMNEPLSGNFFGLGINFFSFQDTLYVRTTMPESPAQKGGILPGDQLIEINQIALHANTNADSIIKHCLGRTKPESVTLTIRRPSGSIQAIRILPEKITRSSLSATVMLDAHCGYIAIETFSETTADAFHNAIKQLKQQGLQQLIVDVRGNPGGYMDAVAQIADELIGGSDTLFYTRDKMGKQALMAGQPGLFESGPLAILIDEESASASEILAGVIQDYDRGRIYGNRSFGKGLVQEQFDLPNGDAIRITTARYYLPSGRFIQRNYNNLSHNDYFEQIETLPNDSLHASPSYTRRLHRKVWSGRGIEPDVYINNYERIEDIPENPFVRKTVYSLYYRDKKDIPQFTSLAAMQLSARLPDSWKQTLAQINRQIPDSMRYWRSTKTAYLEQLALAEWAHICFGTNGQVAFSWPHDATLREARQGLKHYQGIR